MDCKEIADVDSAAGVGIRLTRWSGSHDPFDGEVVVPKLHPDTLDMALAFGAGRDLSPLIIVCGPPASGKSTLAQALASTGWVHLDKDRDGDKLSPQIMTALGHDPDDRDSPDYKRHGHPLALRLLAQAAREHLAAGRRVVVEAPYMSASQRAAATKTPLAQVITELDGMPSGATTIWMTATEQVRRERMTERGAARDAGKLADWDQYAGGVAELPAPGIVDLVISLGQAPASQSDRSAIALLGNT